MRPMEPATAPIPRKPLLETVTQTRSGGFFHVNGSRMIWVFDIRFNAIKKFLNHGSMACGQLQTVKIDGVWGWQIEKSCLTI